MTTQWRMLGLAVAFSLPSSLSAQEQPRTLTQMIIGGGPIAPRTNGPSPVYLVGFEIKPAASSITWRLASEYWSSRYGFSSDFGCSGYCGEERVLGVHAAGLRTFGHRRVQPYLFGGVALYSTRASGFGQLRLTESGYVVDRVPFRSNDVEPAMIWGPGVNARLFGARLFGELRMPMPVRDGFTPSKAPPLMFGFRF